MGPSNRRGCRYVVEVYVPIEKVTVKEVMNASRKMKSGKATGPSEVDYEMIVSSGDTGIKVMVELCRRVSDGRGSMPEE